MTGYSISGGLAATRPGAAVSAQAVVGSMRASCTGEVGTTAQLRRLLYGEHVPVRVRPCGATWWVKSTKWELPSQLRRDERTTIGDNKLGCPVPHLPSPLFSLFWSVDTSRPITRSAARKQRVSGRERAPADAMQGSPTTTNGYLATSRVSRHASRHAFASETGARACAWFCEP